MDNLDKLFTDKNGKPVEYIKVIELANFLRVSDMTILRAIESGDLQAHRYGKVFRITRDQVLAWRK